MGSTQNELMPASQKNSNTITHSPADARPFLKWAGGKTQLLEAFRKFYPEQLTHGKIKNYYEPFLGSGAVFFDIVKRYPIERAFLYDINEELILTYRVLQQDVSSLLEILFHYQKKYSKLDADKRKDFFYKQREQYNQQRLVMNYKTYSDGWFARAAQLIFLNKTCYNGLYRVNLKGEFNSPAGLYENPLICDETNLQAVHRALQLAEIRKADFRRVAKDLKPRSFVYFDPPYRPISRTANFNSYSKHAFDDTQQKELAELFRYLDTKDASVMLSNSDPKNSNPSDHFFDDLYKDFWLTRIPARRMINSNAKKRGSVTEIVVTNYQPNP